MVRSPQKALPCVQGHGYEVRRYVDEPLVRKTSAWLAHRTVASILGLRCGVGYPDSRARWWPERPFVHAEVWVRLIDPQPEK